MQFPIIGVLSYPWNFLQTVFDAPESSLSALNLALLSEGRPLSKVLSELEKSQRVEEGLWELVLSVLYFITLINFQIHDSKPINA